MTRTHFRFLLIASVVVGLVGGFVDLVVPSLISDAFHAAEKAQVDSMSLAHLIAFLAPSVVGALLYFASLYGLYRFRSWAPRMAVVGTALILIGSSVTGTSAQSGVAASLSYLASYLWGAVLVLSYVPSFKNQFLRSADSLERPAK
jgi:hypothetical protein